MKTSFITLACPEWDLVEILQKARGYGYRAVDFRGLKEEIDITTIPAFNENIAETARLVLDLKPFSQLLRISLDVGGVASDRC